MKADPRGAACLSVFLRGGSARRVAVARAIGLAVLAAFAMPFGVAAPAEVRSDVPYAPGGNPRQTLDIYLPAGRPANGRLPVVVYIHGGGWHSGSKAAGRAWLRPLVESGKFAGVAINYRLSGEASWPAALHDAKAAIRWVRAHAEEFGFDGAHIGVGGGSAGATLALLLGFTAGLPEFDGDVGPHRGTSAAVVCVVNYFARVDFLAEPVAARAGAAQAAGLAERMTKLFGGGEAERREMMRAASPLSQVGRAIAPVLTLHGTRDETVPWVQAQRLNEAMRAAGKAHWLIAVEGAGHGFENAEASARVRRFLEGQLLGDGRVEPDTTPIVAVKTKRAAKP